MAAPALEKAYIYGEHISTYMIVDDFSNGATSAMGILKIMHEKYVGIIDTYTRNRKKWELIKRD